MNDKKLRKIKRSELLEILLEQAKKIEELEKELTKTKEALNSKKIVIEQTGNLAEASLKLSKIFETAQQVADEYVNNVKQNCKKLESKTKKECQLYKSNTIKEVELKCQKKKEEADKYFSKMEQKSMELLKDSTNKKKTKTTRKITIKKDSDNECVELKQTRSLKDNQSKTVSKTKKDFRNKKSK